MAIEQMKLLSITGKDSDLEKFLAENLINYDIQIEDAKKIYDKGWKFEYYEYDYRVKEYLKKCLNLMDKFEIKYSNNFVRRNLDNTLEDIDKNLEELNKKYENALRNIDLAKRRNEEISKYIEPIKRLRCLDVEAQKLYDCKYLKFRYGNVPNENIDEIKKEIEDLEVVFFEIEKTDDVTWILYFTTEEYVGMVDGFFNMQKFDRIKLPEDLQTKPNEYIVNSNMEISKNEELIKKQLEKIEEIKNLASGTLPTIYRQLQTFDMVNNLKKYIVKDQNNNFYIVVWVPESNMEEIINVLNRAPRIDFVIKDAKKNMKAPTKLKNLAIFRPFEAIVKMYGVPNISELDPTPFIAIVTCLMFGIMFGDIGHGAVILLAGLVMLIKKNNLGSILVAGGLASVGFGFLYGSVFGNEELIKPILISPMENINTMLISGIVVGTILILISMILNIINGIKNSDIKRTLFEGNGLAGFLMYGFVLVMIAYYFLEGKMLLPMNVIVIIVLCLLVIILFNETITKIVTSKKDNAKVPFVEKIFEIIEMLLSFASNTISFLRLAAFAINHTGLCMAIYLLADMTTGIGNVAISIIGNIVVIILEGLIVGIQVLRLEYYELFSRFYSGNGREYKSIEKQASN